MLGPAPAFAVDAASFVISAATLAGVRLPRPHGQPAPPPRRAAAGPARDGAVRDEGARPPTVWQLLRSARVLQISLLVTVAANLGSGGASEVALPALAHGPLHTGAGGYGTLVAAFGGGALPGTVIAAQARRARRPAVVGSIVFLAEALFLAVVPFTGGLIAVGAAIAASGLCNGFGNVVMITVFQRWAPAELLGRLTGLLMLASFGVFPVSVVLGAVVVHDFGPAVFFPSRGPSWPPPSSPGSASEAGGISAPPNGPGQRRGHHGGAAMVCPAGHQSAPTPRSVRHEHRDERRSGRQPHQRYPAPGGFATGPPASRRPWPPCGAAGRARLRSRIGFALVELGLHLQATAGRYRADGRIRLNERSY